MDGHAAQPRQQLTHIIKPKGAAVEPTKGTILFDICHPAHFHLFKHVIQRLRDAGRNVVITARDKDVTVKLLRNAGFEFAVLSRPRRTRLGMVVELLQRDWKMFHLMRRNKVRVAVGTSVNISRTARLCGARAIIFNEDDADYIPLFVMLAYPLAHAICTPEGVHVGRYAKKQVTYAGYHELAYLHPNVFKPNANIKKDLRLAPDSEYSVIRLSALAAHHDVGQQGLSEKQICGLINVLGRYGKVFVSGEQALPATLEQYRLPTPPASIHDVLANAICLVSDSQTMTMEAAILGVPTFRCNSFVGKCSVIEEIGKKYGLAFGFKPTQFEKLLGKVGEILGGDCLKEEWQGKRKRMLSEKINVSDWMFDFLQSF